MLEPWMAAEVKPRPTHLHGGRGRRRVPADLTAVLIGRPLLVVELELLGRAAVVVAHRLRLLRRRFTQELRAEEEEKKGGETNTVSLKPQKLRAVL